MKFNLLIITVVLGFLNLTACGNNEDKVKGSVVVVHDGYDATLADGIQFSAKQNYPSFIKSVSGMSGYETSGRWTEGKDVNFTFIKNLPSSFTLQIDLMGSFGPNAGKVIQIQIADWKGQFVVDAKPSTNRFIVKTNAPTDSIGFTIPEPKSPKELGLSDDPRQLGIKFKLLSIN